MFSPSMLGRGFSDVSVDKPCSLVGISVRVFLLITARAFAVFSSPHSRIAHQECLGEMQKFFSVIFAAASAAAASSLLPREIPWDGDGPYNVSGTFALPSYDLSKSPGEQQSDDRPRWNMTQKLRYNETERVVEWTSSIIDPVHREDPADHVTNRAIKGWEFTYLKWKGPLRNTTATVNTDCSGMITPDCIDKLKKEGSNWSTLSEEEEHKCGVSGGGGQLFGGDNIQYVASRGGSIASGGSGPTDGVKSYDEEMRRPVVLYAGWSYHDELISEQLVCFGLDNFQPGSRTLAQALSDPQTDGGDATGDSTGNKPGNKTSDGSGDKPSATPSVTPSQRPGDKSGSDSSDGSGNNGGDGKSASSVTAVSWIVGVVALTFTI